MITTLYIGSRKASADLSKPLDISIPLATGETQVNCFYAPLFETLPVIAGDFIGSTAQGGLVNFLNVRLNPHGNGTHTECVGHIAKEAFTINQSLRQFHFPAKLLTVFPRKQENGDRVIVKEDFPGEINIGEVSALIIRTMPNRDSKLTQNYSGSNPPYVSPDALAFLADRQIEHLLIDIPSVDREEDGGKLAAHKAWWQYPGTREAGRENCTITELIFVPDTIPDGYYLLNLQIASFEIDVSPSKPVLYALQFEGL
ncbi:MAG: cyclase family protein [Saprospiraceae bacterium]|nr:cyclase family protein [Saprospiraceae bacterium]